MPTEQPGTVTVTVCDSILSPVRTELRLPHTLPPELRNSADSLLLFQYWEVPDNDGDDGDYDDDDVLTDTRTTFT